MIRVVLIKANMTWNSGLLIYMYIDLQAYIEIKVKTGIGPCGSHRMHWIYKIISTCSMMVVIGLIDRRPPIWTQDLSFFLISCPVNLRVQLKLIIILCYYYFLSTFYIRCCRFLQKIICGHPGIYTD